ncbi:MAG: manganese efflux pump [Oscillospiraceae bacterium]|nr:manganese efflux pump [Oscillospiraceae bacterium]
MSFGFVCNSLLLGAGLAMDAFTVSLANGLNEPKMRRCKQAGIAGMFAGFQTLMPLIGWICVHTILQYFRAFEKLIPWIALLLLCYIGGKMLLEGIRKKQPEPEQKTAALGLGALVVQGIATSIDALSVGFTIADYRGALALAAAVMIGAVTFLICFAGLLIGRRAGMKLAGKATILGGVLLIGIGIEIFVSHL